MVRHVRGASKKARAGLIELTERLEARDQNGFRYMVDFELAKLLVHQKDCEGAAAAIARALSEQAGVTTRFEKLDALQPS